MYKKRSRLLFLAVLTFLIAGCNSDNNSSLNAEIKFSAGFESGSIGLVEKLAGETPAYRLSLRDDNDNAALPVSFRTWWYVRVDNVSIAEPLRLEVTRLGFPYYFIPVYSYDNKKLALFL